MEGGLKELGLDLQDPDNVERWPRFVDGYQVCPFCLCVVHPRYAQGHRDRCVVRREMKSS